MGERVCAVIVTYNRKALLKECLEAVLAQTRPPDHVLVVDNASTDGTREVLAEEFPEVEVLRLPENQGGAGGFHEGLKRAYAAGYTWFWLMDDDTIPEPEALEALLEASQERSYAGLGSYVFWTNGRLHPMNWPWPDFRRPFLKSRYGRPVYTLSFVSVLVPREALTEFGFPNPRYFVRNDDLEFFTRISRKKPLLQVRRSRVIHKTKFLHTQANDTPERFYFEARNRLWLAKAPHLAWWERAFFLLHFLGEAMVFLAKHPATGWKALKQGLMDGLRENPYLG